MPESPLFKVIVGYEDGTSEVVGAVEHEGAVWLVPKWLPDRDVGVRRPERMIRLDQFRHQRFDPPATDPGPLAGVNFALNDPLPRSLFSGELTPTLREQYVVLDKPNARFRFPTMH
jgi:hypothetical protein